MKQKRKNYSKSVIAKYWIEWEKEHKTVPPWTVSWDWAEPSCMACGIWNPIWDNPKTIAGKWNSTSLEKCHVVPLYLGGADDPSNVVLMCGRCHESQPDSTDSQVTFEYMLGRTLLDHVSAADLLKIKVASK